jgi:glycosyltransferase involved in cell wall biosynthesis
MRILIDGLSARAGGGVTYLKNVLPALARLDTGHSFFIVLSRIYQKDVINSLPAEITPVPVELPAAPLARRFVFQQIRLPGLIHQLQINLFFAVAEAGYLSVLVPFVTLARNPSIYSGFDGSSTSQWPLLWHRLVRQLPVFLSLQKADRVIFVSASFRDQVVKQMHLAPGKARVVHHGLNPIFYQSQLPSTLLDDSQPYFLCVSSINPHKNHEILLKAYAKLPTNTPDLVLAGELLHKPTVRMLQTMIMDLGLERRVHLLGGVPYEDLPALYQNAVASIFPSRLETFGHPLVESMAAKTPIIASNLPVCREICQDSALYFDPNDVDALTAHMNNILDDNKLRTMLIARGERRSFDFSWDVTARNLICVFEEIG